MKWQYWKSYYHEILSILDIDEKTDIQSCKVLKDKLQPIIQSKFFRTQNRLKSILSHPVIIAGAGPSLENDVRILTPLTTSKSFSLVSCDGSTRLFMENDLIPDVVFTDLDGDHLALKWALENESLVVIHAHGDNIPMMDTFISKYHQLISKGSVLGTCQCNPEDFLLNYGGFTDGDRAIFTAFHYQSPIIGLIGFDLGKVVGKYSTLDSPLTKNNKRKIKKLEIARFLITQSHTSHCGKRFNLTSEGQEIPGFPRYSISSFIGLCDQWYKKRNKMGSPKSLQ